jgi:hypothetical protein
MADYYPLIKRALSRLDTSTIESRSKLYVRMRAILISQLRNAVPALTEAEIARERTALERAIEKAELIEAEHVPVDQDDDGGVSGFNSALLDAERGDHKSKLTECLDAFKAEETTLCTVLGAIFGAFLGTHFPLKLSFAPELNENLNILISMAFVLIIFVPYIIAARRIIFDYIAMKRFGGMHRIIIYVYLAMSVVVYFLFKGGANLSSIMLSWGAVYLWRARYYRKLVADVAFPKYKTGDMGRAFGRGVMLGFTKKGLIAFGLLMAGSVLFALLIQLYWFLRG